MSREVARALLFDMDAVQAALARLRARALALIPEENR